MHILLSEQKDFRLKSEVVGIRMEQIGSQTPQSHQRWDVLILRQEMRELEREKNHLASKSLERPLSAWEQSRLESLLDDVMQLLQKFSKLNIAEKQAA